MVVGESRGMTPHSSTEFGGRQLIQRPFRRSTAADVDTAAHNRFTTGTIRTEMCAWTPGFRAKQSLGTDFFRAAPGEDQHCFGRKEAFRRATGGAGGRKKGKKPLFFTQQGWLWRHLSEKQQVKDSGVCRVIWTISRGSRHCNSSTAPLNSRIQSHFLTRI